MAEPNYTITLDQLMKLQDTLKGRAATASKSEKAALTDEDCVFFAGMKIGWYRAAGEVGAFIYALSTGDKRHDQKA
jgi:hypothetical protein